ncbi:MAG TPA: ABC transporter ATP-binding protein [Solirubrobacteraceae bacterium]|jgi:iron(III) transport system ATP-binding protein|nr:ABC transporter ATP-binding protein [Solirubrobacteraceae bacterium]
MAELRCVGLAKSYRGRVVLRDVDLEVPTGTLTAILGASGSGKTTLLRAIIGFIELGSGTVTIGGETVADAGRVHLASDKRAIGYVAQEGALFPHLTVGENVGFGLARSQRKQGARIGEVLELVGLDRSYAPRPSHELSGGEQRRVALARALAPHPRIVLLDEPFSGLDAALRADTREAVLHALREEGTTALLVTHDQAEALSMGREVAVLREGRLAQRATPTALYRTPVDRDVAQFVGEAIISEGHATSGQVQCGLGQLTVVNPGLQGPVEVMIRPEQIHLMPPNGTNGATSAGIAAKVTDHAYYGPDTVLSLSLLDSPQMILKARTFDQEIPKVGELVELGVVGPVVVFPPQPKAR